jgi:hypothetical protein
MGLATRKRPPRLVLLAAAIALCAAPFAAFGARLEAQSVPQIRFDLPGGNTSITGDEIDKAPVRHFVVGGTRRNIEVNAMRLSEIIDLKRTNPDGTPAGFDGIGVFQLRASDAGPGGVPIYFTPDDPLYFYVSAGQVHWLLAQSDRDNARVLPGDFGAADGLTFYGSEGNRLEVTVTAAPAKDIHPGDEVTFSMEPTGFEDRNEQVRQVRWFVGDKLEGRESTFTRKFAKADTSYVVSVDVRGDSDSRGVGSVTVDVGKPRKPPTPAPSTGGGGGGTSGGAGGGNGGTTPSPSYTPSTPATPSTPSLPPPSTSPPANVPPSGGPNLDPSAPSTPSTAAGDRVEGILVSANVPASQAAQGRAGQPPRPANRRPAQQDNGVDWLLVGGIALTALLVILGAMRERVHIQRLLPATR